MTEIDVEAFKKEWFSYEEIQDIIEAEKEFEQTWVAYDFEEVKLLARKEIFSKVKIHA